MCGSQFVYYYGRFHTSGERVETSGRLSERTYRALYSAMTTGPVHLENRGGGERAVFLYDDDQF